MKLGSALKEANRSAAFGPQATSALMDDIVSGIQEHYSVVAAAYLSEGSAAGLSNEIKQRATAYKAALSALLQFFPAPGEPLPAICAGSEAAKSIEAMNYFRDNILQALLDFNPDTPSVAKDHSANVLSKLKNECWQLASGQANTTYQPAGLTVTRVLLTLIFALILAALMIPRLLLAVLLACCYSVDKIAFTLFKPDRYLASDQYLGSDYKYVVEEGSLEKPRLVTGQFQTLYERIDGLLQCKKALSLAVMEQQHRSSRASLFSQNSYGVASYESSPPYIDTMPPFG